MASCLDVLFTPAEFEVLPQRDLGGAVCVVFDVLRATTSMVTALANGATEIIPVADVPAALAWRERQPEVLLAGERQGFRIRADQAGGVDFDLGNSPREFTEDRVRGRRVVMTTTNGTRALRACAGAQGTFVGALLNLQALGEKLLALRPLRILLVCGGTYEEAALEDTIAAGGVVDRLWDRYGQDRASDAAGMARSVYRLWQSDLAGALAQSKNGRRLLQLPELRDDVAFAARRDVVSLVPGLGSDGIVRPNLLCQETCSRV
jgi:2-phosphosulfolactate phosphatase